jgi:DNA-binding transcriptional ArsR family regulator
LSRQQISSKPGAQRRPKRRPDPVFSVRDADTLQALAHPIRVQILEALREPASAASVARRIGLPRQKVNYHLKELERAGLVQQIEERRVGNFIESVYRAVARTFLVSPEVAWAGERRSETLRSQHSLETLVRLGERVQHDAASLLDRAAFDGEQIPSASVVAEAHFENEEDREAFFTEYVRETARILERHASKKGAPFRIVFAAYPDTGGESP